MRRLLPLLLLACSVDPVLPPSGRQEVPVVSPPRVPSRPDKPPLQCEAVKVEPIKDCVLYTLKCEDGTDDFALLCPIHYWEGEPPVPRPP